MALVRMALYKDPVVSWMVRFVRTMSLGPFFRFGSFSSVHVTNHVTRLLVGYKVLKYLEMSGYVDVNYYVGCSY